MRRNGRAVAALDRVLCPQNGANVQAASDFDAIYRQQREENAKELGKLLNPIQDLVNCITSGCSATGWGLAVAAVTPFGVETKGAAILFKTGHYAPRILKEGLDVSKVESIVGREVSAMRPNMAVGGDVVGRLPIDGVQVEYRARLLDTGTVNVGTIFPVK